jgi:hypothetical protein
MRLGADTFGLCSRQREETDHDRLPDLPGHDGNFFYWTCRACIYCKCRAALIIWTVVIGGRCAQASGLSSSPSPTLESKESGPVSDAEGDEAWLRSRPRGKAYLCSHHHPTAHTITRNHRARSNRRMTTIPRQKVVCYTAPYGNNYHS